MAGTNHQLLTLYDQQHCLVPGSGFESAGHAGVPNDLLVGIAGEKVWYWSMISVKLKPSMAMLEC